MNEVNVEDQTARLGRACLVALTCVVMLAAAVPASGQYSVFEWASFEDGRLPSSAAIIGLNAEQSAQVVELDSVAGMPADFRSPAARKETGRYALCLKHLGSNTTRTLMSGLLVGNVLDREQLGQNGRALFQADIYLATSGQMLPVAVIAMEPPSSKRTMAGMRLPNVTGSFFRFGLKRKEQAVYFSRILAGQQVASIDRLDTPFTNAIPKPGWHRFTMVFEGSTSIHCYVDGRELPFSPLEEPIVRKLLIGVATIDNARRPYEVYVDNLSIQVSQDAPLLPESPYSAGWTIPPGRNSSRTSWKPAPPPPADSRWIEPEQAWAKAQQNNIPLLLYFYAPGLPGTLKVDSYLASGSKASTFLDQHACAKVDVNQLRGGVIARQYEIYKVPTLLVVTPDAKRHARAVFRDSDSWEDLEKQLNLSR